MDKPLRTTLADAIRFLDQRQIPYALIGGLAASLQGEPRVTADVDAVIGTTVEDALKLLHNLEGSPFEPLFPGVDEVVRQAFILPLRHRKTGVKVDLSIGLSGFEQQLIERAERVTVAGESLRIATSEDLVVMKLLAGRPPFRAASVVETLKQVIEEEPLSVRKLNSSVDRDLETICAKCLEKVPAQWAIWWASRAAGCLD